MAPIKIPGTKIGKIKIVRYNTRPRDIRLTPQANKNPKIIWIVTPITEKMIVLKKPFFSKPSSRSRS